MKTTSFSRVVGVIPAAGQGNRIAPLAGSKEVFPIGFTRDSQQGETRIYPKAISQYLIEQMQRAGAVQLYMVISRGKWDIPNYHGSGKRYGIPTAYLVVEELYGMPYSIDQAYPFVQDATVLFGMADTIFYPEDALRTLLERHRHFQADLTLALFPTDQPWRFSMVEYDAEYRLLACFDKPAQSDLDYTWGAACWGPRFSALLHAELTQRLQQPTPHEIILSDFFELAARQGLNVRVHPFPDGEYIDIGAPHDLVKAVQRFAGHLQQGLKP